MYPAHSTDGPVRICIDPRIELAGMVFMQTSWEREIYSWGNYDHRNYPYFQAVKELCTSHREHLALIIAEQLVSEHHFIWDAIPNLILFHGEPPQLDQLRPYDTYIINRAGNEEILHRFMTALRDLVLATDFEGFFEAHRDFYDSIVQEVAAKFQGQKLIHTLTGFFGWDLASYQVVLAPGMYPGGGYGLRIPTDDSFHSYEIIRVGGIKDSRPYFGSAEDIYDLALHEFAHSYVNPLVEQYTAEIESIRPLYQQIESRLTRNVTRDWQVKFIEQVIHAFQLFVQQRMLEKARLDEEITLCERNGLYLTRELVELFSVYERSRRSYPRFDSFLPEVIGFYRANAMKKNSVVTP